MRYRCEVMVLGDDEVTTIVLDSLNDAEAVAFLDAMGARLINHDYRLSAHVEREVLLD